MILRRAFWRYPGSGDPIINLANIELAWQGIATLCGPSGSGKTTLFRLLSGWFSEKDPSCCEFDPPLSPVKDVRMVGMHSSLLPWYRVRENIALQCGKRAMEDLDANLLRVGLSATVADLYPHQLSLGMYKRVEIIAATLMQPVLLLLDEFFSSMDDEAKRSVLSFVKLLRGDRMTWVVAHEEELRHMLSSLCWSLVLDGQSGVVIDLRASWGKALSSS
jgi:NitT/TauT family transport system ATP-binding protein